MARILVVDDEPDVRELFNITLKMAGHITETAKDGVEAVERLQADIPDLILLDLMMPRMDGFGLLAHIREHMATKPIRVLVATAKVLEESDQVKLTPWPVVGVLNKGELDIAAMVGIVSSALAKDPMKKPEPKPLPVEKEAASAPPAGVERAGSGDSLKPQLLAPKPQNDGKVPDVSIPPEIKLAVRLPETPQTTDNKGHNGPKRE